LTIGLFFLDLFGFGHAGEASRAKEAAMVPDVVRGLNGPKPAHHGWRKILYTQYPVSMILIGSIRPPAWRPEITQEEML
jgi:hypothetical protein